jgi:hypothetical protein
MALRFAPVGGDNPRALLAPVLEGIEAEICKVGSFSMAENPENPTFFSGSIWVVHFFITSH